MRIVDDVVLSLRNLMQGREGVIIAPEMTDFVSFPTGNLLDFYL